jgi:hypothetical protein
MQPRYFDFISYAQLLTISQVIQAPLSVFVEMFNAGGDSRIVRRDSSELPSPESISDRFIMKLGDTVCASAGQAEVGQALFRSSNVRQDLPELVSRTQDLMNHFYSAGFCISRPMVTASQTFDGFTVELPGPAILWGAKALHRRGSIPTDYDVYAVEGLLRLTAYSLVETKTLWKESSLTRQYRIR